MRRGPAPSPLSLVSAAQSSADPEARARLPGRVRAQAGRTQDEASGKRPLAPASLRPGNLRSYAAGPGAVVCRPRLGARSGARAENRALPCARGSRAPSRVGLLR